MTISYLDQPCAISYADQIIHMFLNAPAGAVFSHQDIEHQTGMSAGQVDIGLRRIRIYDLIPNMVIVSSRKEGGYQMTADPTAAGNFVTSRLKYVTGSVATVNGMTQNPTLTSMGPLIGQVINGLMAMSQMAVIQMEAVVP